MKAEEVSEYTGPATRTAGARSWFFISSSAARYADFRSAILTAKHCEIGPWRRKLFG
jgi:hypothetical protein